MKVSGFIISNSSIKKRRNFIAKPLTKDAEKYKDVRYYPLITSREDDAPNFSMRLFEIGPNGYTDNHKHSYEHEVYVLSGNGFVIKDNERIEIEKDFCIFIPPYEKHQLIAGKNGLSFICIVPNTKKNHPD